MGKFSLRVFPEPEELFVRSLVEVESDEYLEPLISKVNKEGPRVQGYRAVGRKLTAEFVRNLKRAMCYLFLQESFSMSPAPYSAREFADVMLGAVNVEEKEHEFFGYFVECEGTFEGFTRDRYGFDLTLHVGPRSFGIIQNIFFHIITLNYVDLEILAESGGA